MFSFHGESDLSFFSLVLLVVQLVFGFGLVLWHINHCWLFNTKSRFTCILNIWFVNKFCRYIHLNHQIVLFLIIQFSMAFGLVCFGWRITYNSFKHQSFVYTQLNDQTILFQTIQFIISHLLALSLNIKYFYMTDR